MDEKKIIEESKIVREYIDKLTPEETTDLMKQAGILNDDGTLTDEYRSER